MRRRIARDPYWTTAKFDSTDANGAPGETAAGEFAAAKQDEDTYASQY